MFLRLAFGFACCFVLSVADQAAAQFQGEFGLSFTSGVTGDGFDYPFSIGPSSSSGQGISPGTFFVPRGLAGASVSTNYFGANLAFFDSNNLLTRPSSRITNDAYWTDPRLFTNASNGFSLSQLGFNVNVNQPNAVSSLGFDLAVASVAAPLPDSLNFQIQFGVEDQNTPPEEVLFFNKQIILSGDSFGGGLSVETGTFQTLGSPFGGRDASVEFDLEELFTNAFFNSTGGEGDGSEFSEFSGPIFIDIDTGPLDNNNGISVNQVAIDNLSINGGAPVDTRSEPEVVNGPTPNGPANPTTFSLTGPPNANVVNVPATTQNGPIGLSVTSGPFTDPGDFRVTLYTPGNADVSGLGEATFGFGPTVDSALSSASAISVLSNDGSEILDLTEEISLELTADPTQAGILPTVLETDALIDAELAGIIQAIFSSDEANSDSLTVGDASELGLPTFTGTSDSLSDDALYLIGLSANDYLGLLSNDGTEPIVGTQGAAFTPSFNNLGELTGGRISSFLVTDSSGTFTSSVRIIAVPEPTSLALLGVLGIAFASRRRR